MSDDHESTDIKQLQEIEEQEQMQQQPSQEEMTARMEELIQRQLEENARKKRLMEEQEQMLAQQQAMLSSPIVEEQESESFVSQIFSELKAPLVFLILFLIFSNETVSRKLLPLIPKTLNFENGSITIVGVMIRAFIATAIFYFVNKFL